MIKIFFFLIFIASCARYPESSFPTKSFVLIDISIKEKDCISCTEEGVIKSSGMIISNSKAGGSYILTAGHACLINVEEDLPYSISIENFEINYRGFSSVNGSDLVILDINQQNDFCLLRSREKLGPPLRLANRPPKHGDRVFNLAAPFGIYDGNFTLTFEGFFSGVDDFDNALYTIPAKAGSSGSPILNKNNQLVGMIHSATIDMENISISTSLQTLRDYLQYQSNINEDMLLLIY